MYYLQSRYYSPAMGRFLIADALVSTGQGILGNNMFAYCANNPVIYCDSHGTDAILVFDEDSPGHVGALIQDENGTWYHFYWGTADDWTRIACAFGFDVPAVTWCVEYDGDLNLNSINEAKQFSGEYEDMLLLQGDFSSVFTEIEQCDKKYNLYSRNCSQMTFTILSHAETEYKAALEKASHKLLPRNGFALLKKASQEIGYTLETGYTRFVSRQFERRVLLR